MSAHNSLNNPFTTPTIFSSRRNYTPTPAKNHNVDQIARLIKLFSGSRQNVGAPALLANHSLPAGYTYLGQFITHDIGAAINMGLQEPTLSLLSLYGAGPDAMPYLYVHYPKDLENPAMLSHYLSTPDEQYDCFRHVKFRLKDEGADQLDVFRASNGSALMADSRNDQNFLINQVHCAFAQFHNALAEWLQYLSRLCREYRVPGSAEIKGDMLFVLTRELVKHYYQRIIAEDYLPKIVSAQVLLRVQDGNYKVFKPGTSPLLMPEFRLAAMRLGHSQVQEVYLMNSKGRREPIFHPDARSGRRTDLSGFQEHALFDFEWEVFFDTRGEGTAQPSAAINHQIAFPLSQLAFRRGSNNLSAINIGHSEEIPYGEELALAVGIAPLGQAAIDAIFQGYPNIPQVGDLPLWPYILLEAEIQQGGQRLGELGGHIVAEQIMWVLDQSPVKYTNSVQTLVQALFDQFSELKKHFLSPTILTRGLEEVGFGTEEINMVNLLSFHKRIENHIREVNDEADSSGPQERTRPGSGAPAKTLLQKIREVANQKKGLPTPSLPSANHMPAAPKGKPKTVKKPT